MLSESLPSLLQAQQIMLTTIIPLDQQALATNLLSSCYQLEETLSYWSTMIPPEFQYTSLPFPNSAPHNPDWYPNSLDIYTDNTMASTWNTWRITRVRVLTLILSCLDILSDPSSPSSPFLDPSPRDSPEYTTTLTTISTLLNAICSSVPYHLGFHDQRVSPSSPQPSSHNNIDPFDTASLSHPSTSTLSHPPTPAFPLPPSATPAFTLPPTPTSINFPHHHTKILPTSQRTAFETFPHPPGQAHYPEGFEDNGAVGGWLMMQPLGFVARCEYAAPGMKDWVRGYLGTFLRDGRGP